jgi:hypothetical protein
LLLCLHQNESPVCDPLLDECSTVCDPHVSLHCWTTRPSGLRSHSLLAGYSKDLFGRILLAPSHEKRLWGMFLPIHLIPSTPVYFSTLFLSFCRHFLFISPEIHPDSICFVLAAAALFFYFHSSSGLVVGMRLKGGKFVAGRYRKCHYLCGTFCPSMSVSSSSTHC